MLFLSYAEEDESAAAQVAAWLRSQHVEFYDWQDPQRRANRFIEGIEKAILRADAFLVLLSPSYLASIWCRRERDLALQREQDLRVSDPDAVFIYVLRVIEGDYRDAGFLRGYDWLDLSQGVHDKALGPLAARLKPSSGGAVVTSAKAHIPAEESEQFRNREDELQRVLRGLTGAGGPHFWLVVAPPQLGKSWFLNRISELLAGPDYSWTTRLVDIRQQPERTRHDARAILRRLFPPGRPDTPGHRDNQLIQLNQPTYEDIATNICAARTSHLLLIDSAELLDERTASSLRSAFGQISRAVQRGHLPEIRLAAIVASRQEADWRGLRPNSRFTQLPLTEFSHDVVAEALRDLAENMGRSTQPEKTFQRYAADAHQLSEGLPALLVSCLEWVRRTQWVTMHRLSSRPVFAELACPYIRDTLLTQESLIPAGYRQPGELHALLQAFRVLAPYRLFTQSHLRHHLDSDLAFSQAIASLSWSMEDLWQAISRTTLLMRPLDEPWQAICPAIRRLLYRYCYQTPESCRAAHREAGKVVDAWTVEQVGKEQVVGLIESLWHEAALLRLSEPESLRASMCESAGALVRALRGSAAYTTDELRDYAARKLADDGELQEAIRRSAGLLSALIGIVGPN